MSGFDEYEKASGRTSCPRCGGPEKHGAVTIRLMEYKDDNSSRFNQLASRQVSMCEDCTVEIYKVLVAKLNAEANGGSRAPRNTSGTRRAREETPTTTTRRRRRTRA